MSCTDLVVRRAIKHDMESVAEMIVNLRHPEDIYDFRNLPHITKQLNFRRKLGERDGFESEPPAFGCVVAEGKKDNKVMLVGYALFFPIYSSREGRSLMLEDLFVKVNERHRGIGNLLFNTVVKEAYLTGCGRLDFHVAGWNRARSWYEGKGAVNLTDRDGRCYWRLSGAALRTVASEVNQE